MSTVQVDVEVTSQSRPTKNPAFVLQTIYVDTGGKYPVEDTILRDADKLLPAGKYFATRIFKKGYEWCLDLTALKVAK